MRISNIDCGKIIFDNGNYIYFDHNPDCCECNYADFEQLDDIAWNYDFNENIMFETVNDYGFRFGDNRQMFFVPCYSSQNGYYSSDVDIYYCDSHDNVICSAFVFCELIVI